MSPPNRAIPDDMLPPQRIESELYLLGAMLHDADLIDNIRQDLRPSDFYRSDHEAMASVIFAIRDRQPEVDGYLVLRSLVETRGFTEERVTDLFSEIYQASPHSLNYRAHATLVRDASRRRDLIAALKASLGEAYLNRDEPVDAIIARAGSTVLSLDEGRDGRDVRLLSEVIPESVARIRDRSNGKMFGVPTGLYRLDRNLGGGLPNGSLTVVAARPGMGKSAFGLNLCERASIDLGVPSLFVSLEMGDVDLGERILAGHSGIDGDSLKRAEELTPADFRRLEAAAERVGGAPIGIVDRSGLDLNRIAAIARRDRARRGLGLLVIDYLGLIEGTGDEPASVRLNRQEVVARMSRRTKELARFLEIPVVLLCQLNRESVKREDRRPNLADLRDSGAIEQDADIVLLLHRPEYYKASDSPGVAECDVAKWRNGKTGRVPLAFRKTFTRFENLDGREVDASEDDSEVDWTRN